MLPPQLPALQPGGVGLRDQWVSSEERPSPEMKQEVGEKMGLVTPKQTPEYLRPSRSAQNNVGLRSKATPSCLR